RALAILFVALVSIFAAPRPVLAAQSVSDLINQLKNDDDYRVRTQAAIALGVSGDDAAVKPLCDAITADSNAAVQVAAAAAIGKLGKASGLTCLQGVQSKVTQPSVKKQIEQSIATLQSSSSSGGSAAPPGPNTKYYVAIQVTN